MPCITVHGKGKIELSQYYVVLRHYMNPTLYLNWIIYMNYRGNYRLVLGKRDKDLGTEILTELPEFPW